MAFDCIVEKSVWLPNEFFADRLISATTELAVIAETGLWYSVMLAGWQDVLFSSLIPSLQVVLTIWKIVSGVLPEGILSPSLPR